MPRNLLRNSFLLHLRRRWQILDFFIFYYLFNFLTFNLFDILFNLLADLLLFYNRIHNAACNPSANILHQFFDLFFGPYHKCFIFCDLDFNAGKFIQLLYFFGIKKFNIRSISNAPNKKVHNRSSWEP